jgi:hypothetical protein
MKAWRATGRSPTAGGLDCAQTLSVVWHIRKKIKKAAKSVAENERYKRMITPE